MALTDDPNFQKLQDWFRANSGSLNMREMFDKDKQRFSKFRWVSRGGGQLGSSPSRSALAFCPSFARSLREFRLLSSPVSHKVTFSPALFAEDT